MVSFNFLFLTLLQYPIHMCVLCMCHCLYANFELMFIVRYQLKENCFEIQDSRFRFIFFLFFQNTGKVEQQSNAKPIWYPKMNKSISVWIVNCELWILWAVWEELLLLFSSFVWKLVLVLRESKWWMCRLSF